MAVFPAPTCVNGLVVLARYPEPGRVKTRLAAAIGDRAAASLQRAFLHDLDRRLGSDPRWQLLWAFEPPTAPFAREIAGPAVAFPQREGDLGARMAGAMADALARGAERVVLIGSDLPHLPPARIADAFERLEAGAEFVLGPAEDGGYYLIGARSVPPVFHGVAWGEPGVLERTLALAAAAGIAPDLLPPTYDLDSIDDLRRLLVDPVVGELSATRAALHSLLVKPDLDRV